MMPTPESLPRKSGLSDHLEDLPSSIDEVDQEARREHFVHAGLILLFLVMIVGSLHFLWGGKATRARHDFRSTNAPASGNPIKASTSSSQATVHSGNPCPSEQSCTVSGDGGVVTALNAFRVGHGRTAVIGSDSTNAQLCALRAGSAPTCVPHYVWTSVPTQDADRAIRSIADFASTWLLDPTTRRIEVGWAWNGKAWECALLKYP